MRATCFQMSFLTSLGSHRVGERKGISFLAPPPRVGDGLHVVVLAHNEKSTCFVRCVRGSFF
jgi:hypothetical protein